MQMYYVRKKKEGNKLGAKKAFEEAQRPATSGKESVLLFLG